MSFEISDAVLLAIVGGTTITVLGLFVIVAVRMAPAMAAGLSNRLWAMADIVTLIDAAAPAPAKRGPYKKGNSN